MRMFLITDNDDTLVGLRLAGIEGLLTNDKNEAVKSIKDKANNREIGIILINHSLYSSCNSFIKDFGSNHSIPLIIEIPDKNQESSSDTIAKYVMEAVGIKI